MSRITQNQRRQALQERFALARLSENLRKIVGVYTLMVLPLFIFAGWLLAQNVLAHFHKIAQRQVIQLEQKEARTFQQALSEAEAYYFAEDWSQAQTAYTKALDLRPTDRQALVGLARTLDKQCRTQGWYCAEARQYWAVCRKKGWW